LSTVKSNHRQKTGRRYSNAIIEQRTVSAMRHKIKSVSCAIPTLANGSRRRLLIGATAAFSLALGGGIASAMQPAPNFQTSPNYQINGTHKPKKPKKPTSTSQSTQLQHSNIQQFESGEKSGFGPGHFQNKTPKMPPPPPPPRR